jgi:membrane-bound lytic murein transglycosylase D
MDVHSAARLAGMSSDEFLALNAAFPRNIIRSDTPVNLLLPVDKADAFQRNLQTGSWDSWQPYSASKGERPEAIAKRFGISETRLKEHNQFHLKRGKLVRAQTILVPVKGRSAVAAEAQLSRASPDATLHNVQRGDTLFGVARRYGLTVTQLTEANPGLDGSLRPGQTLRLPLDELDNQPAEAIQPVAFSPRIRKPVKPVRYTVKRGDTLHAIAQRFDVSLSDLKNWNPNFRKRSTIRAGQTVVVKTR